jgi:hypothetical protein
MWKSFRDSADEKQVLRSLEWREAKGTVLNTEVVWGHVSVSYEYFVDNKCYTGEYKIGLTPVLPDRCGMGAAALGREAKQGIDEFPPGSKLIIRYNPHRPEESVLYCSDENPHVSGDASSTVAPQFRTLD